MKFEPLGVYRCLSAAILAATAIAACHHDHPAYCNTGDCVCGPGADCSFVCDAPPCTVSCAGNNARCVGSCANGNCECGDGSRCDFECLAPPCHADCGINSNCVATCANGSCTCAAGATCDFTCKAGPCHVECNGQNPSCKGECANGTCHCGSGSACTFVCNDNNCKIECTPGASCVLECPNGNAGSGCAFSECASPTICPDGLSVACNTPCPPPISRS